MSFEMKEIKVITIEKPTIPMRESMKDMDELEMDFLKDEYKQDRKAFEDVLQRTKNNIRLFRINVIRKCTIKSVPTKITQQHMNQRAQSIY